MGLQHCKHPGGDVAPEHGKLGQIGLAQRKSIDKMYVGVGGQGRGYSWPQRLWYSLVCIQLVLQHINRSISIGRVDMCQLDAMYMSKKTCTELLSLSRCEWMGQ